MRKTSHLLGALAEVAPVSSVPAVTYLALDLEKRELDRTLSLIISSELGPKLTSRVNIGGLCGTYDDGIAYVRGGGLSERQFSPLVQTTALQSMDRIRPATNTEGPLDSFPVAFAVKDVQVDVSELSSQELNVTPPLAASVDRAPSPFTLTVTDAPSIYSADYDEAPPIHFLFLGSSIGNFTPDEAAYFLRELPLRPWSPDPESQRSFGDTLLLGLDHDNHPQVIEMAYNDPAGYTRRFIMNGLAGVRRALEQAGKDKTTVSAFQEDSWDYLERYNTIASTSWRHCLDMSLTLFRTPRRQL